MYSVQVLAVGCHIHHLPPFISIVNIYLNFTWHHTYKLETNIHDPQMLMRIRYYSVYSEFKSPSSSSSSFSTNTIMMYYGDGKSRKQTHVNSTIKLNSYINLILFGLLFVRKSPNFDSICALMMILCCVVHTKLYLRIQCLPENKPDGKVSISLQIPMFAIWRWKIMFQNENIDCVCTRCSGYLGT